MSGYYLGLGSNQGDRSLALKNALFALKSCGELVKVSSVYETEAKYFEDQPMFLNLVCLLSSELHAIELFEAIKTIEKELGRVETFRNGPRAIDIDLLYSPSETYSDSVLQLPHARLTERAFVLVPFAEIAPDLRIEVYGSTVVRLLQKLDSEALGEVSLYGPSMMPNGE